MKRIISVFVMALVCITVSAQRISGSSSYKDLKDYYSAKNYVKTSSDPYSVFWTGFESLVTPGVGHLLMKETGRGWVFIGGEVAISMVGQIAANSLMAQVQLKDGEIVKDENGAIVFADVNKAKSAVGIMLGAAVLDAALRVWCCIDGVKVAKVKNQYYRDLYGKHAFNTSVFPSVNMVSDGSKVVPAAGMTFALNF